MRQGLDLKLKAWLALSRPPFHLVGVLPFALGSVLAWRQTGRFRWDIALWGVAGVVFVMLAAYLAGEYWDFVEDSFSGGSSSFAGGSQVVQRGQLSRLAPLWGSIISLALALGVGLVLQARYRTGAWTIPLGTVGIIGGFFYSTRPVRWVSTGLGELWIALCYGWLPVAVGYYLQMSYIANIIHWLAIPIGLTILNVILINEYPDWTADSLAGKRNVTVRLGRERTAWLYALVCIGSWAGMLLSINHGAPARTLLFYAPIWIVSCIAVGGVLAGRWRDHAQLERLCAATLVTNLATSAAYILTFWP